MTEFFKETENRRKAEREWLNIFRASLERALVNIKRHQETRLLTSQVILLAFVGAFLVNLLTSSVYDLIFINSQLTVLRLDLVLGISLVSATLLVIIFVILMQQLSKYKPSQPILSLLVKPEDTMPFLEKSDFQGIKKYLESGKLKDFKVFGNHFFQSLGLWFSHLFGDKVVKEPIKEYEESDTHVYKQFPKMTKEYDISAISTSDVKINLEVIVAPHVIYSLTRKGDETASYSFYINFRFKILNPEHCDADKFLDDYYHLYASHIVAISSYCIASAFRKLQGVGAQQKQP